MSEVFNTVPEFIPLALPPVPCRFCGKDAIYSPLLEAECHGMKIFFCYPCQTEYVYRGSSERYWTSSIYADVNGKKYRWSDINTNYILWHIKDPGVPGVSSNKNLNFVASFSKKDAVGITPTNLADKIKTWLPFL